MDATERDEARKKLGGRIRALREGQNIGLRKFALMVGLNKDYLVAIEYGRRSPSLDTLMKIAGGLDVSLSELFEGIGELPDESDSKPSGAKEVRYRAIDL